MKMLILLLLVLLSAYLLVSFTRYKLILAHAHLATIQQTRETLGTGSRLKYIAAGDSTAVGIGASHVNQTYPQAIFRFLAQSNTIDYTNVAMTGATTEDFIARQLSQIINSNPDIITISIGANDVTHWVTSAKTIANYKIIAERITKETKATVYITNVPRFDQAYLLPWFLRLYYDVQAIKINKKLVPLETNRINFINIHNVAVRNSADQFHPNDEGYKIWTEAFLKKIMKK